MVNEGRERPWEGGEKRTEESGLRTVQQRLSCLVRKRLCGHIQIVYWDNVITLRTEAEMGDLNCRWSFASVAPESVWRFTLRS